MELLDFFRNRLQITDEKILGDAVNVSKIKKFRRGEYLIREGEIPSEMFFLISGIVRGFRLSESGKDITDCIVYRCGQSSMPDYDLSSPASISMEALKPTQVVALPMPEVLRMMQAYPSLMYLYQKLASQSASEHRELKMAVYQYTAAQRYRWFTRAYPGLIDRISHKYVASLLDMSPVTLSKMRNQAAETQQQ